MKKIQKLVAALVFAGITGVFVSAGAAAAPAPETTPEPSAGVCNLQQCWLRCGGKCTAACTCTRGGGPVD
jgi:hypothetical protein